MPQNAVVLSKGTRGTGKCKRKYIYTYETAEHGIRKIYSTDINRVMKFSGRGSHDRD